MRFSSHRGRFRTIMWHINIYRYSLVSVCYMKIEKLKPSLGIYDCPFPTLTCTAQPSRPRQDLIFPYLAFQERAACIQDIFVRLAVAARKSYT